MRIFDKMIDQRKMNSGSVESRIRSPRDDICRGFENLNIKCEEKEEIPATIIFKCEVNDVEKESQKCQTKTHENEENCCLNDGNDKKYTCTTLLLSENIAGKEEESEVSVLHNGGKHSPDSDSPSVISKENENEEDHADEAHTNHTERDCVQNLLNIQTLSNHKEKSSSTERNANIIVDSEATKSESREEKNTGEESGENKLQEAFLQFEKLKIEETKDKEEEERSTEPEENKDTSEPTQNDLCSRGPVHNQNFRSHGSLAPYLCSQSRQCGGVVEVQNHWTPVANYEPNIKLNSSTEDQNHNTVPLQLPNVPSSVGNTGVDICSSQDLVLKNMLEEYPRLQHIVDIIATQWQGQKPSCNINIAPSSNDKRNWSSSKSCSSSSETLRRSSGISDDESNPTSPVGSPTTPVDFPSYNSHPSPSGASLTSSGVSSIKDSPQYIHECFNETPNESYTAVWVQKSFRPICPKPPPIKVDPNSYRSKLMKELDDNRRLFAWARVHSFKSEILCAGDKDGDTNLMIIISNKHDSQKEYIYALVERLRHISGALSQKNALGHSALYLASLEMCDEPIIAAYIAEALVEQNVDIAKETYNGLTLPQILQRKGDPCKGVLEELLKLKNRSGQSVFNSP